MVNRRGFLGALAAAAVLDPERALWVPGAKLISVPAPAPPVVWYRGRIISDIRTPTVDGVRFDITWAFDAATLVDADIRFIASAPRRPAARSRAGGPG